MQTREDSSDVRVGGPRSLHQVPGDFPTAANTSGIGGATQNLW